MDLYDFSVPPYQLPLALPSAANSKRTGSRMGDHDGSSRKKVSVVILPIPIMGHLMAMAELAKHLLLLDSSATDDGIELAISILNIQPVVPSPQISSYIASVSSSHPGITFHDLPKVEPPAATKPEEYMASFLELHKSLVRDVLQAIRVPVAALVLDLFCTDMIDVAKELGIPSYIFFTSGASFIGLLLHLPDVVPQLPAVDQYEGKTITLPGFSNPLSLMSLPEAMMYPGDLQVFRRLGKRYPEANGILINTFAEFQSASMKALEEGLYHLKAQAVYAVGPILSLQPKTANTTAAGSDCRHECIRWLDEQPPTSVVFLCFGSMGSFPTAQAREIAAGLERSGQRFLWVLRSPLSQAEQNPQQEQGAARRFASLTPVDAVLEEVLPEGFLDRMQDRGMVWPSFAPQAEILAHGAVGGFVTHCGWNSCLESIWFGVPMAAWPLYAEQHFNAFEMVKEMGVAIEVRIDRRGGNTATAEEVDRVVSLLMENEEGGKVREKARHMKSMARSALHKGGSSSRALQKFAQRIIS